jgi:parallel beta-helix repeat protein
MTINSKYLYSFLILLLMMIVMAGGAEAVNVDCNAITENMNISANTTFNTCVLNLTDPEGDGAIKINPSNNRWIDCNGSTFVGNNSPDSYAIKISTRRQIEIRNCNFINYTYGINILGTGTEHNINHNNFTNILKGIYSLAANSSYSFNNFLNSSLYAYSGDNNIINDNSFICPINGCGGRDEAIYTIGDNELIYSNVITGGSKGIWLQKANNVTVYSNIIRNNDQAMYVVDSDLDTFYSNVFDNNSNNYDDYNLDVEILNSTNQIFQHNLMNQSVDVSAIVQMSSNITFWNNTFNMVCFENRSRYNGGGQNEPCTAIEIKPLYKTYNYIDPYPYSPAQIAKSSSSGILISNNTFTGDPNTFIYLMNASGVTIEGLPSYWYRAYQWDGFSGLSEYYINNVYNTVMNNDRGGNNQYDLYEGWYLQNLTRGYEINKTSLQIRSSNASLPGYSATIFNLSFLNPYNGWHILNGSTNYGYVSASSMPYFLSIGAGERWTLFNDTCTVPFEDYTVNTSTTFCPGTYYLYDTNGNGAISNIAANTTLDCAGATLIGNLTTGSRAISISARNNITIQNCNIKGYTYGILFNANARESFILNNNISNTTTNGAIYLDSNARNNTILGNYISNSTKGIALNGDKNNTFVNNQFENNTIFISATSSTYDNFYNNSFLGHSNNQYQIDLNGVNFTTFSYNTLNNVSVIMRTALDTIINHNTFINYGYGSTYPQIENSKSTFRSNITNNYFNNIGNYVEVDNIMGSNILIKNNTMTNFTRYQAIKFINSSEIVVDKNNINNMAKAFDIDSGSSLINITNNKFDSFYNNFDTWNMAIWIAHNSSNILIDSNNFTNFTTTAVLGQQVNHITITNNYCDALSTAQKINLGARDYGEASNCFVFGELEFGFTGDTLDYTSPVSFYREYASDNVTISGNTFGPNVQVYLKLQYTSNATHQFSYIDNATNWYRKLQFPVDNIDAYEYFINPSIEHLTRVTDFNYPSAASYNLGAESTDLYQTIGHQFRRYFNYSVSKTQMKIVNTATNYSYLGAPYTTTFLFQSGPFNISVFNLTPPNNDVYNVSNGQIIAFNQPSWTATLGPGAKLAIGSYDPVATCDDSGAIQANVPDGYYNISYSYQRYGQAHTAVGGIINKLVTLPTWLGIILVVAFAMIIIGLYEKFKPGY